MVGLSLDPILLHGVVCKNRESFSCYSLMMVNVCELATQVTHSKNYLLPYLDLLTNKEEKNDGTGERNKGGKQKKQRD